MSREVCGICWCPYDQDGWCGCEAPFVRDDTALLRQALGALKSIMEIDSHSALTETEADAINAKADAAIAALRERLGETK